jgi:hypothetical protein
MKYLFTIALILTTSIPIISGQENPESKSKQENLYLSLRNVNFIKNNEYFNPIVEGYTLVGYFIQPAIVYSPSEKVRLQLGTHILNYAGADKISQAKLVFSTTYNFSEETYLTIGTLNGSDKHRMFDPHFDLERFYTGYAEDGLQFVTVNNYFFNDTWLSWENFIFKGDTTREVFTFGESFKYTSGRIADIFQIETPIQFQLKHRGGQISNYSEHVETYFNLGTGVRINFDLGQKRFGTAGVEYLKFIYNEFTQKAENDIMKGGASWIRLHYNYKWLYLGSYFWKSHNFFAPNGNAVYSSVSEINEDIIIPDRKIWTNSIYLTFLPLSYLEIFLGLDTYYDLNRKRIDTSTTLHLSFEKLIKLATIKK